jgi:predicted nucleic acid-binding protein
VDLIADTTFLVGLWRRQAWAMEFAADHRSRILGIPWVVLGEFWHGAIRAGHAGDEVRRFLGLGIHLVAPEDVITVYGQVCTRLQKDDASGYRAIGQNDLWIAATAVHHDRPLVSRNRRHFEKVAGLKLVVPGKEGLGF